MERRVPGEDSWPRDQKGTPRVPGLAAAAAPSPSEFAQWDQGLMDEVGQRRAVQDLLGGLFDRLPHGAQAASGGVDARGLRLLHAQPWRDAALEREKRLSDRDPAR